MRRRGRLITFEGLEGGGKSTQIARLAERLRESGREILVTREPGGTAAGEIIREILQHDRVAEPISPEAEALLFAASRAHLVRQVILPALRGGTWVLCDRFADSTTAYQGFGRGLPMPAIVAVNALAVGPATPDLTILLDIDVGAGLARLRRRRGGPRRRDRIEREARRFHEKVRQGYLALAARNPDRFRVIATDRPAREVQADVWRVVTDAFGCEI